MIKMFNHTRSGHKTIDEFQLSTVLYINIKCMNNSFNIIIINDIGSS